ncbi:cobalamin-dependent protein [Myxococcota bacterium]|nr:cobalamin-dependent protein [Myxococcota bacterium]MBU1430734.1 cobalamin-dependent protein [Myxococcota bacterium]MBU1900205.1 cobalamin-dependent protein [Myxococcota bacterium]
MARVCFSNVPLLKTCIGGLCPSLTFIQLGGYLQAHGHEVIIHDVAVELDTQAHTMDEILDHMVRRIVEIAPDILGLSAKVPADGRFTRDLIARLRPTLPGLVIIAGGIWATPADVPLLEAIEGLDAVVRGEGERGVLAIADRIDAGEVPIGPEVPGISYRDEAGQISQTPSAPPPRPEALPPLALDLMPSPDSYTIFPFLTSKGCPFDCTFCSEKVIFPQHIETPLARLEADLKRLDDFGRDYYLWLSDPLFGLDAQRTEAICALLGRSRFDFLLESRVDVLRPQQLPLLSEAGCEVIYFGLESASFETLKRLNKVRTRAAFERYLDMARAQIVGCMEADITPIFGVLNPVPGDTLEDLRLTYAFLKELEALAIDACHRSGEDPGFHFYSFQYRFIRGSDDFNQLDEMAARGATWLQDPSDAFRDIVLHDASPEIPFEVAMDFHKKVSALVRSTPIGFARMRRSFPSQPKGGLG